MDYRRRRLGERITAQVVLALTLLATALVQTTLLPAVLRSPINLLLLATICWTMLDGVGTGALVAFYGGLALDVLGHTPVGSHALALLLVAAVTMVVAERLPTENWVLVLVLAVVLTPIYHLVLIGVQGGAGDWLDWAQVVVLTSTVIHLVLVLPLFVVLRWWQERHTLRMG